MPSRDPDVPHLGIRRRGRLSSMLRSAVQKACIAGLTVLSGLLSMEEVLGDGREACTSVTSRAGLPLSMSALRLRFMLQVRFWGSGDLVSTLMH